MKVIALVTQKGGAGKSTLACSLAVAARESGESVCLIDLDRQETLTSWGAVRPSRDIRVLSLAPGKLAAALKALNQKDCGVVIIDTPGVDGAAAAAAMEAAHLCLVPARPTAFDLWASQSTRKALKRAKAEYAFVLNQCPPAQQSARIEDGVAALEEMGGLLSPLVRARVDYQEAGRHGLGVTEYNPGGAAAGEMRQLWASLKRRLAKGGKSHNKAA